MAGVRARGSLATVRRALFELRRIPATKEELLRHVEITSARSFGSIPEERLLRQFVVKQLKDGLIDRRTNILPQGVRVFNRPLHSSRLSQAPSREAISKVAGEEAKSVRTGPVTWASLALLVVTGVGLILLWEQEKKRQLEVIRAEKGATAKTGPGVGKAAIGGPFKLLNQDGKVVTDRDFVGNWTLIYFGFTYCPDICPDELTKLAEAVDQIEKKFGLQVLPVFITIDPERDTVEQVREYLKEYHPRYVGLTGTVEDIRQVAREYRVYYMKTEDEGTDYLVDHSIITYLMDPDMNFVKFFGKNYDADSLADGVIKEIKSTSK
jgi:protein SCO1/2